jgi:hypothetical protein
METYVNLLRRAIFQHHRNAPSIHTHLLSAKELKAKAAASSFLSVESKSLGIVGVVLLIGLHQKASKMHEILAWSKEKHRHSGADG